MKVSVCVCVCAYIQYVCVKGVREAEAEEKVGAKWVCNQLRGGTGADERSGKALVETC